MRFTQNQMHRCGPRRCAGAGQLRNQRFQREHWRDPLEFGAAAPAPNPKPQPKAPPAKERVTNQLE